VGKRPKGEQPTVNESTQKRRNQVIGLKIETPFAPDEQRSNKKELGILLMHKQCLSFYPEGAILE